MEKALSTLGRTNENKFFFFLATYGLALATQGDPMARLNDPSVQPDFVQAYLKGVLPFSELDPETLAGLAAHCRVDFRPKGELIMDQGKTVLDAVHLVQKGGVRVFFREPDGTTTLLDYRGEKGFVGVASVFQGTPAEFSVETVEDTFFITIAREAFVALVAARPEAAGFFLRGFSENYLAKVFEELRFRREAGSRGGALYARPVGQTVRRSVVDTPMGVSLRRAARIMEEERVGSILIRDASGAAMGVVTDRDLRRAVALGVSVDAPVETMMSVPVESIEGSESNFEALARMMSRGIHHLAVTDQGRVSGVISSHDILLEQGVSPMTLYRRILDAREFDALYSLSGKLPLVVRALLDEGATSRDLNRLLTIMSDAILRKVLELLHRAYGPTPVPYCWLVLGGEGRGERNLASDQDNALIFEDREDEIILRAADIFFTALTKKAVEHLARCGLPRCPGGLMADNPALRLSLAGWTGRFAALTAEHRPEEVARHAACFDFRAGHGQASLALALRERVTALARDRDFLARLAEPCLEADAPLSFFRNFLVEQDGAHQNALDLKRRGIAVFVDFARVLALKHTVPETGTLPRLTRLAEMGVLPVDLAREARDSFAFLTQLRLSRQLARSEAGQAPDHFIDPAALTDLERRMLKDSFGLVRRMQDFLKMVLKEGPRPGAGE